MNIIFLNMVFLLEISIWLANWNSSKMTVIILWSHSTENFKLLLIKGLLFVLNKTTDKHVGSERYSFLCHTTFVIDFAYWWIEFNEIMSKLNILVIVIGLLLLIFNNPQVTLTLTICKVSSSSVPDTSFSYRIQPPKKRLCTPCPPCLQPRLSQLQPYTTSPLACLLLLCLTPAPSGRVDHKQAPAWSKCLCIVPEVVHKHIVKGTKSYEKKKIISS